MKISKLQLAKNTEAKRIAEIFSTGNVPLNIVNLIHWFEYAFECGVKWQKKEYIPNSELIKALQILLKAYQSDNADDFYNLDPEQLAINTLKENAI